jgi:tetratricopeptide (TPR) repeat protein
MAVRHGRNIAISLLGAWCAGTLAIASLAAAQRAPAAQSPAADDYEAVVQSAVAEFGAGHYLEARAQFMKAHELRPTARTLRGLGLAEFELGRYAQAMRMLRRALIDVRNPLTDVHRAEAEKLIERAAAYVARYRISREPSSAELLVDGEPVALLGDELVLDIGQHRLLARAPGHTDKALAIDVRGGEQDSLHFVLERASATAPAIVVPSEPAGDTPPIAQADRAPEDRGPEDDVTPLATWGLVAAGASALSFGGAILAWRLGVPAEERWNSDACLVGNRTREENCREDREAAESAQTWTIVGLAAGGALAVTAAVLLLTGAKAEQPSDSGLACGGASSAWGIECSLRL